MSTQLSTECQLTVKWSINLTVNWNVYCHLSVQLLTIRQLKCKLNLKLSTQLSTINCQLSGQCNSKVVCWLYVCLRYVFHWDYPNLSSQLAVKWQQTKPNCHLSSVDSLYKLCISLSSQLSPEVLPINPTVYCLLSTELPTQLSFVNCRHWVCLRYI